MSNLAAISNLHASLRDIRNHVTLPKVFDFPALKEILDSAVSLLSELDEWHLHGVPELTLTTITKFVAECTAVVSGFIIPSINPEPITQGLQPSQTLIQNSSNINRRLDQLKNAYAELYALVGPIVALQSAKRLKFVASPKLKFDDACSEFLVADDAIVWRYMPLGNLFRWEAASGIWLSSMAKLREWRGPGIPDIQEGDVPPQLSNFQMIYEESTMAAQSEKQRFQNELRLDDAKYAKLRSVFRFNDQMTNAFVSSWIRKDHESSLMWTSYADSGRGVAVKSRISCLRNMEWRMDPDLAGVFGNNRFKVFAFRKVRYLPFDVRVPLTFEQPEELYLPFLKRIIFQDEHEVRIVGFTTQPLEAQGFYLRCNLSELIEEIVIGPHADFEETVRLIKNCAHDLHQVRITRSDVRSD